MKMLQKLAAAAAFATLSMSAQAYQGDAGIGYLSVDMGATDFSGFAIGGEYNFEDVDPGSSPYGEAAFLAKSSDVHAAYTTGSFEPAVGADVDSSILLLGIEFFVVENFSLGLDISNFSLDDAVDSESSTTTFSGGYYFNDTTRIGLAFSQGDLEDNVSPTVDTSGLTLEAKTLIDDTFSIYASHDTTTAEGVGAAADLDDTLLTLGGVYYLNQSTGIGAEYVMSDLETDADESTTIGLSAQVFLNESTYIEGFYSSESFDIDPDDTKTLGLSANMRF